MTDKIPGLGGLQDVLSSGKRQLEGKSFYLDSLKSRSLALLVEAISHLGGRVEDFLNKDVSFVVTGSKEGLKKLSSAAARTETGRRNGEVHHPTKQKDNSHGNTTRQQLGTTTSMRCGSRGKALLEKAIRNNERLQGSSVLANARSWGVKIFYVNDFLLYLQKLTAENPSVKRRRQERTATKCTSRVIKAVALKSPYLKIEDTSRKYRPLCMQSMTWPVLCYSGRFSPFETPRPPQLNKVTDLDNGARENSKNEKSSGSHRDSFQMPLGQSPSHGRAHKKNLGYCECCHKPFTNQEKHLQSDPHREFVLDPDNYSVLDQLVADMQPGFDPNPPPQASVAQIRPPTPPPMEDHNPPELQHLTDTETEQAIQVLLTQNPPFSTQVSSPLRRPSSPSPDPLPSDDQLPAVESPAPPADGQPFSVDAGDRSLVGRPLAPSPGRSSLDALTVIPSPDTQLPDTQPLFTGPDTVQDLSYTYSQPPVLSPEVLDPYFQPHSSLPEPPILSPQVTEEEEDMEVLCLGEQTSYILPHCMPDGLINLSAPLLPVVVADSAGGLMGSGQKGIVQGVSGLANDLLECAGLVESQTGSSMSETIPNPRKRRRSTSPENNTSKKSRTLLTRLQSADAIYGCSAFQSGKGQEFVPMTAACSLNDDNTRQPPVRDITEHMPELVHVNRSPQKGCSVGCNLALKPPSQNLQTLSAFTSEKLSMEHQAFVPLLMTSAQKSPEPPKQTADMSGTWSTSEDTGAEQPSSPLPLNTGTFSSSDSDWDCELLSRLNPAPPVASHQARGASLEPDFFQRSCTWTHNASYESHLYSVIQPNSPGSSLCRTEKDLTSFSRTTVIQSVEVHH